MIKRIFENMFNNSMKLNEKNILKMLKQNPEAKILERYNSGKILVKDKDIEFILPSKSWEIIKTKIKNTKNILEMGCGAGVLLYNLNKEKDKKANLFGVDISKFNCKVCSTLKEVKIINGDATNTPFSNEKFDFILSTQMIEHVDDIKFLKEVKRILQKGGYLFISTVIKKGGWYFYKNKNNQRVLEPTHLREYSKKEIVELLKSRGFSIEYLYIYPVKYPLLDLIVKGIGKIINKNILDILIKNKGIIFLRKKIKIKIPGYFIVDILSKK